MHRIFLGFCAACLTACASTHSDFVALGGETFAAKPQDHNIDVFTDGQTPDKTYVIVAEVFTSKEAHLKTYRLDDALVELKQQTRAVGGDAIIAISEKRDRHLEAFMYIVSAKAVRYTQE